MKRLLFALLALSFLTSCGRFEAQLDRLRGIATDEGKLAASTYLPEYPTDCRTRLGHGVREGDSLVVALRTVDARLDAQNARITRCAGWYDGLREGLKEDGK